MTKLYCAIIGDIVRSRDLPGRSTFQARLLEVMDLLSLAHQEVVVSRFVVTAGDEFQALLSSASPVYDIFLESGRKLGVALRLGIGLGTLQTDLRPEAIGMDGPAFHRARSALDRCKAEGLAFSLEAGRPEDDSLINSHVALLEHLRRSWTPRQREIIEGVKNHPTQRAAAETLGVSGATVSRALKTAGFSLYREGRETLRAYLGTYFEFVAGAPATRPPS